MKIEPATLLSSMTGFGRGEGVIEGTGWVIEAKSVNARGLDIRCRLPAGLEMLEADIRRHCQAAFRRGTIQLAITLRAAEGRGGWQLDEAALERLLALADRIEQKGAERPRIDALLAIPGILLGPDRTDVDLTAPDLRDELARAASAVIGRLAAARREEGAALGAMIAGHVAEIERLTRSASQCAGARPQAHKARLQAQMAELLEGDSPVSEDRLAHELAILATRADVREELDRLLAHIDSAQALLAEGGAIGRQLDFLCQEFNREANTLCAKSHDIELTRIGLALKSVIDRLREQVQNLE